MASNYWGIPRTTYDIDFVVSMPLAAIPSIVREFSVAPPVVSIFNFHYANPPTAGAQNYALNKVIDLNEMGTSAKDRALAPTRSRPR